MCSENVLIIVGQLYYSRSSNQGYDDAICNIFVTKLIRSWLYVTMNIQLIRFKNLFGAISRLYQANG